MSIYTLPELAVALPSESQENVHRYIRARAIYLLDLRAGFIMGRLYICSQCAIKVLRYLAVRVLLDIDLSTKILPQPLPRFAGRTADALPFHLCSSSNIHTSAQCPK